jgi:hypothetical protein
MIGLTSSPAARLAKSNQMEKRINRWIEISRGLIDRRKRNRMGIRRVVGWW